MKKILAIVAHPDDEVLGCGGTLAKHVELNDKVYIHILSEGHMSRTEGSRTEQDEHYINSLKTAANNSAKTIGAESPFFDNYPDNNMDSISLIEIIKSIEKVINEVKPDVIYTHHIGDLNIDHQIVHQAVLVASRPVSESIVKKIYSFETLSSTEWSGKSAQPFVPSTFIDISSTIEKKIQALHCYENEMRESPHARSYEAVKALSIVRGSSAYLNNAEAFMLIREIID